MANPVAALWRNANESPDLVAVRDGERTLSYSGLRDRIACRAREFSALGVKPGDRVLFIAPSVPEFVVTYYALHTVGATVITMNVMSTVPEIDYVVDDSGLTTIVAWHASAEAAEHVARARELPFVEIGAFESDPDTPAGDAVATGYVERADDDDAVILYTSGTTGKPKGAALTISNLNSVPVAFHSALALDAGERWATALPLFHCFGQAVVMHNALTWKGTLSLLSPFAPDVFMDRLRDEHITIACGVPTMWNAMLQAAGDRQASDFADLRLACSGGASLPGEVLREFSERFGCTILEGYGLTETAGTTTFSDLNEGPKVGTIGKPLPGFTIEIRDPDGNVLPAETVGEVFVRGPSVMKGYWNRPDATASTLQDGWLATGDLGSVDPDGNIRIVDRKKDLIIRGGYNVYPKEVEEVLYTHPDIVEVAVIGVPDDHYGEEIAAAVALRPGATGDRDTLRAWCKERLSAYKVPRIIVFVDALPKGSTGKILKRAIDIDALTSAT